LLAPPLVIWVSLQHGWQTAFVVTGGVGFIWVALWWSFYRSPQEHWLLGDRERQYIQEGQEPDKKADSAHKRPPIKKILSNPKFWGIAIPRFLAEPAWQTFNFWIPLYLATVRHMNLKEIAIFAWLPFLAADLGGILGGYLSPLMMKVFKVQLINSRIIGIVLGALLMIGPGSIGLVASPYTAIALFCMGGFAHQMISALLNTLSADVFDAHEVATANGFTGTAAWTGGLLFSLIVGALANSVGYGPLFACLALFDIVGAIVVITLVGVRGVKKAGGAV
jgi:ACS family hexuronate transporter-like MFS transporter